MMEPKKNPKYDVHKKRNLIFNFSLALSLLIVISAFRIAIPIDKKTVFPPVIDFDEVHTVVPITDLSRKEEPAKPKPEAPKPINLANIKEADMITKESPDPGVDQNDPETDVNPFIDTGLPPEIPEDTTDFIVVEHPPEPVGGYAQFYKTLKKNMDYPTKAKRYDTQGRVIVQFTIDKTGELTNFKVLRGIGNGCDEEAIRVIKLTKWLPGKQRGRPVNVKKVLPVVFELHR